MYWFLAFLVVGFLVVDFLVSWFQRFLVSKILGFRVSWFRKLLVSWFLVFKAFGCLVSKVRRFNDHILPNFHFMRFDRY